MVLKAVGASAAATVALTLLLAAGAAPLPDLVQLSAVDGVLDTTLNVIEARWNPGPVSMNTRSYDGKVPGPVWRLRPGDTLKVRLNNKLVGDDYATAKAASTDNQYGMGNVTNIHTHGLHVSPEGVADNIFLHAGCGESLDYVIPIPANHGPGTHWFHAHAHMSTNLQVQNGLLGTIIIDDDTNTSSPTVAPAELRAMREVLVVLQHVILDTSETDTDAASRIAIEDLSDGDDFDLGLDITDAAVAPSFYTANGVYAPTITVAPGELVRLRLVHAGHRHYLSAAVSGCEMYLLATDGIYLDAPRKVEYASFVPGSRRDVALKCATAGSYTLTSSANADLGNANVYSGLLAHVEVTGAAVTMALPTALPPRPSYCPPNLASATPTSTFHVDFGGGPTIVNWALVGAAIATLLVLSLGHLALWCFAPVPPTFKPFYAGLGCCVSSCQRDYFSKRARGDRVGEGAAAGAVAIEAAGAAAPDAAGASGPKGVDRAGRLAHTPFCNWVTIAAFLVVTLCFLLVPPLYMWGYDGWAINGAQFTGPDNYIATLKKDTVEEVTIAGGGGGGGLIHPYHQHIVPAQIIKIPGGLTTFGGFTVGDWYDVVAAFDGGGGGGGGGGGNAVPTDPWTMRFVPADFIGHFVIHCHILAHEDVGMMAVANIVE